jgi:hypothetical protein
MKKKIKYNYLLLTIKKIHKFSSDFMNHTFFEKETKT